jgi:hypothetical protein
MRIRFFILGRHSCPCPYIHRARYMYVDDDDSFYVAMATTLSITDSVWRFKSVFLRLSIHNVEIGMSPNRCCPRCLHCTLPSAI